MPAYHSAAAGTAHGMAQSFIASTAFFGTDDGALVAVHHGQRGRRHRARSIGAAAGASQRRITLSDRAKALKAAAPAAVIVIGWHGAQLPGCRMTLVQPFSRLSKRS